MFQLDRLLLRCVLCGYEWVVVNVRKCANVFYKITICSLSFHVVYSFFVLCYLISFCFEYDYWSLHYPSEY